MMELGELQFKMIINGKDIDEVLYKTAKALANAPEYKPRDQLTKELIQPTLITEQPDKCIITNPARKLSKKYMGAEILWYFSMDKKIDEIKNYGSLWERIAENGKVNSNYGEIIFGQKLGHYKGSQYAWAVNSLKEDKDTRQALININQPKHKKEGVKDFPCTETLQYMIRDNKLIGITNMRSNDLIFGFSFDFPFFSLIQQNIHNHIQGKYPDVKLGKNIHTAGSLHVYERHFDMLEDIIKAYEKPNETPSSANDHQITPKVESGSFGNINKIYSTLNKWKNES